MKDKLLTIIICAIFVVLGICGGFGLGNSYGFSNGNTTGYDSGFERGKFVAYDQGYTSGYEVGKEYVVAHLDQYVTVPKDVSYAEVVRFLKDDKTDDNKYTAKFNCISFANMLRQNANAKGIRCGIVYSDFTEIATGEEIGHDINCFQTSDQGIVYFDPQTDGQRYGIYVGGTYTLQGITYKITKVDIIW